LVGEGNFTFAAALATLLPLGGRLTATSYDSADEVAQKYGATFEGAKAALEASGARVLHSVDATQLEACQELRGEAFDVVWWNLPHVGGGHSEADVESNRLALRLFFRSARGFLLRKSGGARRLLVR